MFNFNKVEPDLSELYSEPCRTYKIEYFAKMVNGFQGSEYAFVFVKPIMVRKK